MRRLLASVLCLAFASPVFAADPLPSPTEVCAKVEQLMRKEAKDIDEKEIKSIIEQCITEVAEYAPDVKEKTIKCIMASENIEQFMLCEPK